MNQAEAGGEHLLRLRNLVLDDYAGLQALERVELYNVAYRCERSGRA